MSKPASDTSPTPRHLSCSSDLSAAHTPASTTSSTPSLSEQLPASNIRTSYTKENMDDKAKAPVAAAAVADRQEPEEQEAAHEEQKAVAAKDEAKSSPPRKKARCSNPTHKKKSQKGKVHGKEALKHDSSSEDDSSSDEDTESTESEDISSSEDEKKRKRKLKKQKVAKKAAKDKKRRKGKKVEPESDSDASDDDTADESSSESEVPKRKKKGSKKAKKAKKPLDTSSSEGDESAADTNADLQAQIEALKLQMSKGKKSSRRTSDRSSKSAKSKWKVAKSKKSKDGAISFKRVDQLWDTNTHNYKLKESAEDEESEFAEFGFLVRRTFDWENKYQETLVDIKHKQLRAVLQEVMKGCKSVSLEAEEPSIQPNLLFLYLEELRSFYKALKPRIKTEKKRKPQKKLELQRSLCKVLVKYLDDDYAETKKTLYPLLENGNITFDLLWALYKPNDVAITSCYGSWDDPRCFKVDYVHKFSSMMRGEWYCVEGKYMEYDGKNFGLGDFEVDVEAFKGPRKITSLATYPLRYHATPDTVKQQIIERGKHFVSLEGMQYRFHKGLAFHKKRKNVIRISVNGRVMIDPACFRRINPNYPISFIKPHEDDELASDSEYEDDDDCSCCDDEDDGAVGGSGAVDAEDKTKIKYKIVNTKEHGFIRVNVETDMDGNIIRPQKVDELEASSKKTFSDEELLLTSPVVMGFAFTEKLWLEFTISGIQEIQYNEGAFESLVLPPNQKSIVRALVESHKHHGAQAIDDVVQGKGKGLVAVLHGPPGTGKTLTAEGISEMLRCPLYMVSAGELGTDPGKLELELQKILDIAHSWGAVLLLDEADVFLEKREVHDIHRNALVSIFLRLLEYFQGILFLTTNRVETFDDAFQSRIHVALRYGDLKPAAKKAVWKMFIDLCRGKDGPGEGKPAVGVFSEHDFDVLARKALNGRQIKNIVRTAQALSLNENETLCLTHVQRVMDVAESFEKDLKGGSGYDDAMRSYT